MPWLLIHICKHFCVKDANGSSPLLHALDCGHEKIAIMLLAKRMNLNCQDQFEYTALIHTSNWGTDAIVRLQ